MEKKSLVFTEQFYYPDGWGGAQLPRDITMALAENGWDVKVVCGSDPYAPVVGDQQTDPASVGVKIRRVPRVLGGDLHKYKLLRQLWYYVASIPLLLFGRASVFIAQTNPPLSVPIVATIAMLRRRPFVVIAQDIYPEVIFAHGMLKRESLLAGVLARIFRWAYRRADAVVSLGPHMSSRLLAKGVARERIAEIANWATGDERIVRGEANRLRSEWGLDGKFVVLYSGNLGIAHDIETPIAAIASALKQIPNLALVFVGKGSRFDEARALASKYKLDQVAQFRTFVPFELLPHTLGLADVALVTLLPGFEGLVVPSKLLGHLARGVPTLYIGPASDISQLVRDSEGGFCVESANVGATVELLVRLAKSHGELLRAGEKGKRYYEARLTKAMGLAQYVSLLARVAAQNRVAVKGASQ